MSPTKLAKQAALDVLKRYRVPGTSIYLIGLFDGGVTVLSQQRRALNLAWALVETETLDVERTRSALTPEKKHQSVAIVGGGFSGLTVAAGLLAKGFTGKITIFEQRDTLLPLQHGSDTRWLHPNIYDWPDAGSEVNSAMLPLMNWTAARASDVAVQSIENWRKIARDHDDHLELYCNARHVKVDASSGSEGHPVEWAGDRRATDGSICGNGELSARGKNDVFDHVILATGYGLEIGDGVSYWRNDRAAQPTLERARLNYIVSGQGDGAMIDLLRLKISNFRQDRILHEMFGSTPRLRRALEQIKEGFDPTKPQGLVGRLKALEETCGNEFELSIEALKRRLRRDTEVSLGTRVNKIGDLLESPGIGISFQNRVLVYFLYMCGGFFPVDTKVAELARAYGVPKDRIVTRHGTDRPKMLRNVLSAKLADAVLELQKKDLCFLQTRDAKWSGGYFGIRGPSSHMAQRSDQVKAEWRMEYLPGPTQLLASTFCSTVGAFLSRYHTGERLRVTLHRAMRFGNEEVLQQCCPYFGTSKDPVRGAPGRTFPAANGTIGAAYTTGRLVRSSAAISNDVLKDAMMAMNLNTASRRMSDKVSFLMAIPIVEPQPHTAPCSVAAVLYIDSIGDLALHDDQLRDLVAITQSFVDTMEDMPSNALEGIYNARMADTGTLMSDHAPPVSLPPGLEEIRHIEPPRSSRAFQLNFESSDFIPVKTFQAVVGSVNT